MSSANRQSTASVRVGSSPSSSAVAVASRPTGATRYSDCAAGCAPASTRAPSFATSSVSLAPSPEDQFGEPGAEPRAAHPDARGPRGRRGRIGDFFLLAVLVPVEAAPGLAAQQPRVHALGGDGRRAEARFLVILPVDRFHHRVRDVEARQVEQLERSQAESGAIAQDAVDPVELRDALAENAQSLGAVAAAGVVDDEARRVLRAHRLVPAAQRERRQRLADPGSRQQAVNDLDDFHQRHGIEEMKPGDALGPLARRGDRSDRKGRGIGRHQAIAGNDILQRAEQLALGVQILDDRLDDYGAGGERRKRVRDDEIRLCPRDRVPLEPAFFGELRELRGNRLLRVFRGARAAVVEQRADAGLCGDLGDAASHDAGADHRQAQVGARDVEGHDAGRKSCDSTCFDRIPAAR